MTDPRVKKFAEILVDFSANIQPGDRVLLEGTTAAMPLFEALYKRILERGGHPYPQMTFPTQQEIFFNHADEEQLSHTHIFTMKAYEEFESRIRIHSLTNTESLSEVPPEKQALAAKAFAPITATQMRRGATKEFKWVTTLFPTQAYADQAGMRLKQYENFVYQAVQADSDDPVAYWQQVEKDQERYMKLFEGADKVILRGPNVDLRRGILLLSFAVALLLIGVFSGGDVEGFPFWAISLIPGLIGAAYVGLHFFAPREPTV